MKSKIMTFQIQQQSNLVDAIEQWLRDNKNTSAESRIPLASLLSVPSIRTVQLQLSFLSHDILALLQQHPKRIQVGDTHTKNPWIYSIAPVQQRTSQASLASATEQRNYLATSLMPEDDAAKPHKSASIVLFAPSATGGISVLMAQSKNGKFGFTGATSQPYEKSLFETAQRGFDESTGGVLQVIDDMGEQHLAPELARAAGTHGQVMWNKGVALFFVPLACLPGNKAEPGYLPQQHQRMLQNPAVHQDFKRKLSLAWCDLRWNDESQSLSATIPCHQNALADWAALDLECESFKTWFKQNVGLATSAARASSSSFWIRDYVTGAKSIFQSIPSYCMKKPKDERLQACNDRLQRLSGIVTTVLSECSAVGPEDCTDRDKLFATVSETCVLLQEIADELDRSDERRAFICRCNEVADLCERERRNGARTIATKPEIQVTVTVPQKQHTAPVHGNAVRTFASGSQQQPHLPMKACGLDDLERLLSTGKSGKITFKAPSTSRFAGAGAEAAQHNCRLRGCLMPACAGKGGFCTMHGGG